MTPPSPLTQLEDLRRAIDAIDDAMLDLLQQRFQAVEGIKSAKTADQAPWPSPLRPAREMQILRRLAAKANGTVPIELLVRLWRSVVTEATLSQSHVVLNVPKKLAVSVEDRILLRDYFGRFEIAECRDETQALVQVNVEPGHISAVDIGSPWIEPFLEGKAGKAQVIAALPALRGETAPRLLVFGVAPAQATGEDETLIITKGSLPRDFSVAPLWQMRNGTHRISALAGFFSEHESPLVSLNRSNPVLGLAVAGRYPSPLSV